MIKKLLAVVLFATLLISPFTVFAQSTPEETPEVEIAETEEPFFTVNPAVFELKNGKAGEREGIESTISTYSEEDLKFNLELYEEKAGERVFIASLKDGKLATNGKFHLIFKTTENSELVVKPGINDFDYTMEIPEGTKKGTYKYVLVMKELFESEEQRFLAEDLELEYTLDIVAEKDDDAVNNSLAFDKRLIVPLGLAVLAIILLIAAVVIWRKTHRNPVEVIT